MNKVLQRIAIAESQGWKHVICSVGEHGTMMSGWWMPCGALTTDINMLPDYCNDLNAMHEAWQTLTSNQKITYRGELAKICAREAPERDTCWLEDIAAEFAPEAFLRTLELWEEEA